MFQNFRVTVYFKWPNYLELFFSYLSKQLQFSNLLQFESIKIIQDNILNIKSIHGTKVPEIKKKNSNLTNQKFFPGQHCYSSTSFIFYYCLKHKIPSLKTIDFEQSFSIYNKIFTNHHANLTRKIWNNISLWTYSKNNNILYIFILLHDIIFVLLNSIFI